MNLVNHSGMNEERSALDATPVSIFDDDLIDRAVDESIATGSVIYFILVENYVKIGTTKNIGKRFSELQTGSPYPMTLAGTVPGNAYIEAVLHHRWRGHAVRGEWFVYCSDIRKFIKKHVAGRQYVI